MNSKNRGSSVLAAAILSTLLVGCGGDSDTLDRTALERESLSRELELALQPDTTQRVTLTDIPLEAVETPPAPPTAAPVPAPRPAPTPPPPTPPPPRQTTPRPSSPAPAPTPAPTPAPVQPRVVTYTVAAGTTFGVQINDELSTRNNVAGSSFTATLTESIRATDGTVLIPAGATVRGTVVESRESGRAGEDAYLAVAFNSISSGGRTYSISGSPLDTPVRLVTRDSRGEQAAKIGGGAAIGAILGQVLGGNTRATVAGAAVGAAAGTAVAIGTADVDAVVDAGSRVTIRLDRGVTIEG